MDTAILSSNTDTSITGQKTVYTPCPRHLFHFVVIVLTK